MEIFRFIIVVALIVVPTVFLIRGLIYRSKFENIKAGMTYDQVISIVGTPYESSDTGRIKTCVWRIYVFLRIIDSKTVTFEDDKVLHITEG